MAGWVKEGCIMSPWLFNLYMDAMIKGENADGNKIFGGGGERGNYQASCLQMTWFCAVSRNKT